MRIDWDNDGFYCREATPTDPPNLIPTPTTFVDCGFMGQGGSVTAVQADLDYGHTMLQCQTGTGTSNGLTLGRWAGGVFGAIAVDSSTPYTVVVWLKGLGSYAGVDFVLEVQDQRSLTIATSSTFRLNPEWTQASLSFTTNATTTHVGLHVRKDNSATDVTFAAAGFMLVAGASAPTAFNSGPSARYDDISSAVIEAEWSLGMDGGAATLKLRNDDRRFSPDYASSPLYGDCGPGRRLSIEVGGTVMWQGWITSIEVGVGLHDPFVIVQARQGRHRLAATPVGLGVQLDARADTIADAVLARIPAAPTLLHYFQLDSVPHGTLEATSFLYDPADQLDARTGQTTFSYLGDDWDADTDGEAVLNQAVAGERGDWWQRRDGLFILKDRHYWTLLPTYDAVDVDQDAVDAEYLVSGPLNHVQVVCYPRAAGTATVWTLDAPLTIGANMSTVLHARLTDAEGERVGSLSLDAPTYTALDGAGIDRSSAVDVVPTAQGSSAKISITNRHSAPVTLTTLTITGATLSRPHAITVEAVDQASIDAHGRGRLHLPMPALDDAGVATDLTDYLVYEFGTPRGRFAELTARDEMGWTVGTRLAISEHQTGGTALDYVVTDERWRLTDDLVGAVDVRPAGGVYWIVQTSTLDANAVLGY